MVQAQTRRLSQFYVIMCVREIGPRQGHRSTRSRRPGGNVRVGSGAVTLLSIRSSSKPLRRRRSVGGPGRLGNPAAGYSPHVRRGGLKSNSSLGEFDAPPALPAPLTLPACTLSPRGSPSHPPTCGLRHLTGRPPGLRMEQVRAFHPIPGSSNPSPRHTLVCGPINAQTQMHTAIPQFI